LLNDNYKNSKHQKPNIKQIPMTNPPEADPKKGSAYICVKWHIYLRDKLCEAILTNGGVCFGHWILKFEIYPSTLLRVVSLSNHL
jgi:hypothetical protein